jgi:hypothetical protein
VGKGKRIRQERRAQAGGYGEMNEALSSKFQEQIRSSPLWEMMVKEFGETKAKELLKECKGEIRPCESGFADASGNHPEDI